MAGGEPDTARGEGDPEYEVWRPVHPRAGLVLAANPSAMTLAGTNTWLLRDRPDRPEAIVVDPGPDDPVHLGAVAAAAGRVVRILLTHGHSDHSAGARTLHELTGAPVLALDPRWQLGGEGLHEGDVVAGAGVELLVWGTPGHTADSMSFLLGGLGGLGATGGTGEPDRAVLTGDTILGRGSTVIAEPDGDLGAYLDSLQRLSELGRTHVLPGHGPDVADAAAVAQAYLSHRAERLTQVRNALAALGLAPEPENARAVVEVVYADVVPELWPVAQQSVRAQFAYLRTSDRTG